MIYSIKGLIYINKDWKNTFYLSDFFPSMNKGIITKHIITESAMIYVLYKRLYLDQERLENIF